MNIDISAIIPAYNEERRIGSTLRQYAGYWRQRELAFEILVVLNGCTDETAGIVAKLQREFPEIRSLIYPHKLGKGGAIIEGLKHVSGRLVVHTDADGATDVADVMKLMAQMDGHDEIIDGIIGSRWMPGSEIVKPQPLLRIIAGRIFNFCTRVVLSLPFADTQCGAKVFRREMLLKIIPALHTTNYAVDACILYHARRAGFTIKEVPIRWESRAESKVHVVRDAPGMLFAIILTRLNDLLSRHGAGQLPDTAPGRRDRLPEAPFFSIIIPCRAIDDNTRECLEHCLRQDYGRFEILLLPDRPEDLAVPDERIRVIPTGPVKPSTKRNLGLQEARPEADIIAFIDADAYPAPDWLNNSRPYWRDPGAGAVGGPNLTPPEDSIWQKVSGDILSMPMAAGKFAARYRARTAFRKRQPVQEMPSVNLFVRRDVLGEIGGFDTTLLTAEDSKLCFQILRLGLRIIYAPDVIVYHHRRPMWWPHLKQVWTYGRDKAWLIKEDFSADKLYYFIPLTFLAFQTFGALSIVNHRPACYIYLGLMLFYLAACAVVGLRQSVRRAFLIVPGIFLTHLSYGLGSLYGLITQRKADESPDHVSAAQR